jgi:hypothetical protein
MTSVIGERGVRDFVTTAILSVTIGIGGVQNFMISFMDDYSKVSM